jgi:hypothetical protein
VREAQFKDSGSGLAPVTEADTRGSACWFKPPVEFAQLGINVTGPGQSSVYHAERG